MIARELTHNKGNKRDRNKTMKKTMEIPKDISEKIHFYGVVETPSDLITFFCGSYQITGNVITVNDLLLDASSTKKSYIMKIGKIFFEKVEFISYMAMFFPYVPYKYREENPKSE